MTTLALRAPAAAGSHPQVAEAQQPVPQVGVQVAQVRDQAAQVQGQVAQARNQVAEARAALNNLADLSDAFKYVNRAIEPSVVEIRTRTVVRGRRPPGFFFPPRPENLPDEVPWPPHNLPEGVTPWGPDNFPDGMYRSGNGSGVILAVEGNNAYILTNNHVVDDATELEVVLLDRRVISDVTIVGTDPQTDLAVVRIQQEGMVAANWGDSATLEKGDWVLAFGSPFGYVGSMSAGIVSGLNRTVGILGRMGFENFIQTDAAINPGNSGGPLANLRGEVIGINTAIATRTGTFSGIGFAVPSQIARPVFERLREDGRVVRGWLGISIVDVATTEPQARALVEATGFAGRTGVLVAQTVRDGPAHGILQAGDVITEIDGTPVRDVDELRSRISATRPGTDVRITLFREGSTTHETVRIGEQPTVDRRTGLGLRPPAAAVPPAAMQRMLGVRLAPLDEQTATQFGLTGVVRSGAVVMSVDLGSLAAQAGLRQGDVITRANGVDIASPDDVARLLPRDANEPFTLRMNVVNREGSRFVLLRRIP